MEKKKRGLVVVLCGPSGVGKDSIVAALVKKHPDIYEKFANVTTRAMRPGEVEGKSYHFVTEPEFKRKISAGEVFEHTHHYGAYYGMSRAAIESITARGKVAVNTCDIVGIRAAKAIYGAGALTVLVKAPRADIEKRLIGRGDSAETRAVRLSDYDVMVSYEPELDCCVENIELAAAAERLHQIITERLGKAGAR
jgi:guanylate kinase